MVKGYKGFDKDLKCRGFQYEVGKTYKEDKAKMCDCGFHFCENPFDVFSYYNPADSRYGTVSTKSEVLGCSNDSKKCSKSIKIEAEIGLSGIINAGVKFILDKVNWKDDKATNTGYQSVATNTGNCSASTNTGYQSVATNTGNCSASTNTGYQSASTNTGNCSASTNTGNYSASTNTGYQSASTNTGNCSASTNTGDYSASTNTGNQSVATNTGDYSASTNTGYQSVATNTGNCSASTNTGYYSASTNTGYQSVATNTGYYSASTVEDKESIAISLGIEGKAKANIGSWIVLSEWKEIDNEWHRVDVKSFLVNGKKIKADTFYTLKNGEVIEWVDEDE
ncbi:hypothetical protein [Pectinatus frisingensis]|uniref:DUF7666 domain-containing protein n=1 Tax=Pectinatus frisingensis TaxID=865 RepID=UPI0018C75563|nr:hypothetical protein [Pectinatus frisingensis]